MVGGHGQPRGPTGATEGQIFNTRAWCGHRIEYDTVQKYPQPTTERLVPSQCDKDHVHARHAPTPEATPVLIPPKAPNHAVIAHGIRTCTVHIKRHDGIFEPDWWMISLDGLKTGLDSRRSSLDLVAGWRGQILTDERTVYAVLIECGESCTESSVQYGVPGRTSQTGER